MQKMLIIDDAAVNRLLLAEIYRQEFEVLLAENGRDGLRVLEETPDIAVVILDLAMPEMDGFAFLAKVRARHCWDTIPVIVNTIYGNDSNEIRALELGADDFIFKPLNPDLIRSRVNSVLHQYERLNNMTRTARQLEERIQHQRRKFFDNSVLGGMIGGYLAPGFPLYFINERMLSHLGYATEADFVQDVGGNIIRCVHPEDRERTEREVREQLAHSGKYTVEHRIRRKDGSYIWMHAVGERAQAENGADAFTGACFDITDRVLAEEEKELAMRKLRAAMEHVHLYTWEYDPEAGLSLSLTPVSTRFNRPDGVLTDFPESAIRSGLVHADSVETFRSLHADIRGGADSAQADLLLHTVDGGTEWVRMRYTVLTDGAGRRRALGTVESIADYKALEERFRLAAAQVGAIVWSYDLRRNCLLHGDMSWRRFGLTESVLENVPHSFVERGMVHPDDIAALLAMHTALKNGAKTAECEVRLFQPATADWLWMNICYTLVRDKFGEPTLAVGTGLDIQKRKLAELRYAEGLALRRLTSQRALASYVLNLTRDTVEECRTELPLFSAFAGMSAEAFLQASRRNVMGEQDRAAHAALFSRAGLLRRFSEGRSTGTLDVKYRMDDEIACWLRMPVELTAHPLTGDVIAFTYAEDVTREHITQIIMDTVGQNLFMVAVYINVHTGRFAAYGQNASSTETRSGYDAVISQKIREACLTYTDVDAEDMIQKMTLSAITRELADKPEYTFYVRATKLDGTVSYTCSSFRYGDAEKNTVIFLLRDVSDTFRVHEKHNTEMAHALALAQQANAAKDTFLSSMSHDLRTPMNAVVGMTELALADITDTRQVTESLSVIEKSSRHLLELINDLLDMSRLESGKLGAQPRMCSFSAEMEDMRAVMEPLFRARRQTFITDFSGLRHDHFIGDPSLLHRVLRNLLANACKFTPEEGCVRLTASEQPAHGRLAIFHFEVSDNGPGIAADVLPHIFEPFRRGRPVMDTVEGSGLGLAIVKSIVSVMGGSIAVQTDGQGSTFTVEVPLPLGIADEEKPQTPAPAGIDAANALRGKRVLLVEDHPVNVLVARRLFERMGAVVELASNGQEGVERWQTNPPGYYDVIFMDMQMPVMDGCAAAQRIRGSHRQDAADVPVVALTANAFQADKQRCLDAGMDAHVAKPMTTGGVLAALRSLRGWGTPPAPAADGSA